jgi:hypothetical protein
MQVEIVPQEVRWFSMSPNGRTFYDYRDGLPIPGPCTVLYEDDTPRGELMKPNYELIERRSERAELVRRRFRSYRIGFFSVLGMLALSEIQLDLSDQIGKKVKFHLNPTQQVINQSNDCK